MHYVEEFPERVQLGAMLAVLPSLAAQAPGWSKVLHYRIVNIESAKAEYRAILATADPASRRAACAILTAIGAEGRVGTSDRARELAAAVCTEEPSRPNVPRGGTEA